MEIVSPKFFAPYPIDLVIVKNVFSVSGDNFSVADNSGNKLFKVKDKLLSLRDRRILLDATAGDIPILFFRQSMLTTHNRWRVFRGDGSEENELLFSVKKSSMIQLKLKLDVFLGSNTSEDVCDFRVEGESPCTIYSGYSTNIVAQMHKKHSVRSKLKGKATYIVTVYPNVDYAFIVALLAIIQEINTEEVVVEVAKFAAHISVAAILV